MTLPATSRQIGGSMPTANDRDIANQLRRVLASSEEGKARVQFIEPQTKKRGEIALSPVLADLFLELLRHISSGNAVTLVPTQQELTTQQAADLINVSRPYLVNLLIQGKIPYSLIGRHRRILAKDLFEYKRVRDSERKVALDRIISDDSDLV